MKVQAAVLWGTKEPWSVEEVDLDPPKEGEVLVKLAASGLCHSDEHVVVGDIPMPLPAVGGHEGAGVVEEVGPNVSHIKPGQHCVLGFIPGCGQCRWCASGHSNLCDMGAQILGGCQLDGTYRFHAKGQDLGQMCLISTFSPYTVVPAASVVPIDDDLPLDKAALVGCGVTTGWGSAVYAADVQPGETVVIMGIGGVGANAVQGARIAGAQNIVAIDPVPFKREQAESLGATHSVASANEATALVSDLTRGVMAEKAIITTDILEASYVAQALGLVAKRGRVVCTSIAHPTETKADMSLFEFTLFEKQLVGSLFGSANPKADIPRLMSLYRSGDLKLDELVTKTYPLAKINEGYQDMRDGKNIRGMVIHDN
ncbi:MAG: NDMA-dependent alcohol dehydrogenase [Acidimicrobiia bacterium]